MIAKPSRQGKFLNPNRCHGAETPDNITLADAQQNYMHYREWMQQQRIASYSGRNSAALNGNYVNNFYIITNAPVPESGRTTARLGIRARQWDTGISNLQSWYWDGSALPFSPVAATSTTADTRVPTGDERFFTVDYTPTTSNNGFVKNRLYNSYGRFASLDCWSVPPKNISPNEAKGVFNKNFASGQNLRGYDSDAGTSAARIIHDTDAANGLLDNTRQCLFQTMWPKGLYVIGTGALGWQSIFPAGFKYKVRGRNLRGRSSFTTANLDLAVVATADPNTGLRFTSAQTGHSVIIWTPPATPNTMSHIVNALKYDPRGDEISVEAQVSSGQAVVVQTLSAWERPGGTEV